MSRSGPAAFAVTVFIIVAVSAGCGPAAGSRTFITIATGGTGGVYYPLGGTLARIYSTTIPGVNASAQATVASVFNVQAVQQGKADLAFTQGDIAYLAYSQGTQASPEPHAKLRGVAVLYLNTVQIVARRDSGVRSVRDLHGRRVGVGAPASGTEAAARIIIEAHGLRYPDVHADYLSFSEIASHFQDRTIDAGVVVASYPVAAVTDVALSVGIRLLPVEPDAAARIQAEYPFFKRVVIPPHTYRGQDEAVETVAVDNLLVCRDDLDDALVYQLTRIFFESLPELAQTHAAARAVSLEEGPNTPIPLHPGAARYYRERGTLR